jgi:hypothetical protein
MDPIYLLILIFVPVPVMLLYAIIVDIYDRKKQFELDFNQLQSEKLPTKSIGPNSHKMGQPSAS